jgi:hypothetical protein
MEQVVNKSTFTKNGYIALNKAMLSKNFLSIILIEIVILAGIILAIVVSNWTFLGIFGFLFVFFPLLVLLTFKSGIKKVIASGQDYFDKIYYQFTFKKDIIEFEYGALDPVQNEKVQQTEKTKMQFSYETIYRVIENKEYIFIFIAKNQGYTLLKKEFSSEEELIQVRTWIKAGGVKYILRGIK